jgi:phage shock protein A
MNHIQLELPGSVYILCLCTRHCMSGRFDTLIFSVEFNVLLLHVIQADPPGGIYLDFHPHRILSVFHSPYEFCKEVAVKLFKKLAINVHSRVEAVADRIENKEALSTACIHEYERIVAKAKVRSAKVENEVSRLEKEAARLSGQAELWAGRARQVHSADESRALACVARMTQVQAAHGQVLGDLEAAKRLKKKMATDVEHILKKLEALRRRHRNLAGRQACAEAFNAIQRVDGCIQGDIDDLFTRWETDVVAQELHVESPDIAGDALDEEFATLEQEQALRLALEKVLETQEQREEKE